MRLYEIIDFTPRKSQSRNADYISNLDDKTSAKPIGKGAFGTGYQTDSNKRLNQVTKLGRAGGFDDYSQPIQLKDLKNDGYITYLKYIQDYNEEEGKTNPYFPVVHDLKIFKDKDGKIHYRANLEKLIPFTSPKIVGNEDLITSLYEHMFGTTINLEGRDIDEIADIIRLKLVRGLDNPMVIADPELRTALACISEILESNSRFVDDLHGNNLMWRITGTMPHLVILDPVA